MKAGTWSWVKIGRHKVEVLYTDRVDEVEQLAATSPKETWEGFTRIPDDVVTKDSEKIVQFAAIIRAVKEQDDKAGYFFNGWYAAHDEMMNALNIRKPLTNSFVYSVGQMNEKFGERIREWLEDL